LACERWEIIPPLAGVKFSASMHSNLPVFFFFFQILFVHIRTPWVKGLPFLVHYSFLTEVRCRIDSLLSANIAFTWFSFLSSLVPFFLLFLSIFSEVGAHKGPAPKDHYGFGLPMLSIP